MSLIVIRLAKDMDKDLSVSYMKYLLITFCLLFFSTNYVLSQKGKTSESQITVISGPSHSFNNELIGQYSIESRAESVVVYVIIEEFDNQKSLKNKIDSMCVNSFLVFQGKTIRFDLVASKIGDKYLIGVERKGANAMGFPIQLREGETLMHKLYLPENQDLMKKIPIALIYANVNDKSLKGIFEDKSMMLSPAMSLNDKKNIYNKLSHYYIVYYQLKLIGQ